MKNAHIAIHFSKTRPNGVVVIQPRNTDGQFLSPNPNRYEHASTAHFTRNGIVTRKTRF